MILTENKLKELTLAADVLSEAHQQTRFFSIGQHASVFLSHKHDEISQLKRVAYILEELHASIYVDWLDNSMPKKTSGTTATIIKQQIQKYDKFILVATDGAIDSKWCNWELGYGDAQKFDLGKIALFPIAQNDGSWKGSEYMQIYPTIQYYSGTEKYSNGNLIPRGYYYCYNDKDGNYRIQKLYDWIVS